MWRTLLILALAAPAAAVPQSPSTRAADEAAVRNVIGRYVDAREARDPQAIEAIFTADADQHTTSGEWRRGRDEVIRGSLGSSQRNRGKRGIRIETVRFITPDVAIADGPYEIATEDGVRRMWTTIVLERERGAWRVTAIRNMVPAATSPPPRVERSAAEADPARPAEPGRDLVGDACRQSTRRILVGSRVR